MKRNTMNHIWLTKPSDAETRKGSEPIDWAEFKEYTIEDGKFLVRPARNTLEDLEKTAKTFKSGFPVLRGCEFEALFDAKGFYQIIGEGDSFNKGLNFMILIEHVESGDVAAALIITLWKMLRRGEHLVIAVHEKYQGNGLGHHILTASDKLFEDSGVEMAFGWCAAFHTATQKILADLGYTARAVIPGLYRIWAGDNEYRRTVEVFFQKFYKGAEKMCTSELLLHHEVKESLIVPW